MINPSRAVWRKSSRSGTSGGDQNCVEVAALAGLVAVRDSKNPDGPHHEFSRREITSLARRIKRNELDL